MKHPVLGYSGLNLAPTHRTFRIFLIMCSHFWLILSVVGLVHGRHPLALLDYHPRQALSWPSRFKCTNDI